MLDGWMEWKSVGLSWRVYVNSFIMHEKGYGKYESSIGFNPWIGISNLTQNCYRFYFLFFIFYFLFFFLILFN